MTSQPPQSPPKHKGAWGLPINELQDLIDSTPSLQCQGDYNKYAPQYGWVPRTKGVWVLENATDAQLEQLNDSPPTEDLEVVNGYLRDAGAVFYADYVWYSLCSPMCFCFLFRSFNGRDVWALVTADYGLVPPDFLSFAKGTCLLPRLNQKKRTESVQHWILIQSSEHIIERKSSSNISAISLMAESHS